MMAVEREFWFGCEIFIEWGRCSEMFISRTLCLNGDFQSTA